MVAAQPDEDTEDWYTDEMFDASCCGNFDCRAPGATWYYTDDGDLWCLCQVCGYHGQLFSELMMALGPVIAGVQYRWVTLPTWPELARRDAMRAGRRP